MKRYTLDERRFPMQSDSGRFVYYSDVKKLEAERDELRAYAENVVAAANNVIEECDRRSADVKQGRARAVTVPWLDLNVLRQTIAMKPGADRAQVLFDQECADTVALEAQPECVHETGRYRKRPVVIDAMQFTRGNRAAVMEWCGATKDALTRSEGILGFCIPTLEDGDGEGQHIALVGDWIIRGVKGEHYPCKPDIFAATYEPADFVHQSCNDNFRAWWEGQGRTFDSSVECRAAGEAWMASEYAARSRHQVRNEDDALSQAVRDFITVFQGRHYGRMPDEVAVALENMKCLVAGKKSQPTPNVPPHAFKAHSDDHLRCTLCDYSPWGECHAIGRES